MRDQERSSRGLPAGGALTRWYAFQVVVRAMWWRVAVVPLVALVVALLTDFGDDVHIALYEAVAPIAPVIALAVLVENAVELRSIQEDVQHEYPGGVPQERRDFVFLVALTLLANILGLLVVSEVGSLYAIGAGSSSTLLLVLSVGGALALLLRLFATASQHFMAMPRPTQASGETQGKPD
jgi:hypothetical protein